MTEQPRWLRKRLPTAEAPLIFIVDDHALAFLPKPVEKDALVRVIHMALEPVK